MPTTASNQLEENGSLLVIRMAERQTGLELQKLKVRIINIAHTTAKDVDILVDVSRVKTSDESANAVAKTFFEQLPFHRMAVFGGSMVVNAGIKVILNLFVSRGVGEVKLFRSEQKARSWLG